MKLACEGSDFVAEGETADAVHAAMMAHGDEAHSNHCRCSPSVEYPILNIRYSIFNIHLLIPQCPHRVHP